MMMLRERNKQRTRDALSAAAVELFASAGFDATTIDDIAERAEVSRRTFFRYYPSKEAVLFPDRERRLVTFRALLAEEAREEEPLEAVRRGMMLLAEEYMAMRERVILQQRIVESSPALLSYDFELDKHWEAAIAELLGDRRGQPVARRHRARLTAGAMMGVIRVTLREWYDADGKKDLVALGAEAFAMVRDGVGDAVGGERKIDKTKKRKRKSA